LATALWTVGGWFALRRRQEPRPDEITRHDYRTQTRGMALRMTERLRDRLRPSWLRLRRETSEGPADEASAPRGERKSR